MIYNIPLFMNDFRIGIVGSRGIVAQELIHLLEQRNFSKDALFLFQRGDLHPKVFEGLDLVFFCSSNEVSRKYIPYASDALVIDSSSAFRSDPNVPLIIPEINADEMRNHKGVIASPNCTATLMLLAVAPLYRTFGIERLLVTTYQAASGGGKKLLSRLKEESTDLLQDRTPTSSLPYGFNLFLHESPDEEIKMVEESRKILKDPHLRMHATCVRVPVMRAHSMVVNVTFTEKTNVQTIETILASAPGITLHPNPTPAMASGKLDVYVGRIRTDPTFDNSFDFWIVGDQLLKGAALNALQIAIDNFKKFSVNGVL